MEEEEKTSIEIDQIDPIKDSEEEEKHQRADLCPLGVPRCPLRVGSLNLDI